MALENFEKERLKILKSIDSSIFGGLIIEINNRKYTLKDVFSDLAILMQVDRYFELRDKSVKEFEQEETERILSRLGNLENLFKNKK